MAVRGAAIRIALTVQKLSLGCRPIVPARRASPSSFTATDLFVEPSRKPTSDADSFRIEANLGWIVSECRCLYVGITPPMTKSLRLFVFRLLAGFLVFHDSGGRALWSAIRVFRWILVELDLTPGFSLLQVSLQSVMMFGYVDD